MQLSGLQAQKKITVVISNREIILEWFQSPIRCWSGDSKSTDPSEALLLGLALDSPVGCGNGALSFRSPWDPTKYQICRSMGLCWTQWERNKYIVCILRAYLYLYICIQANTNMHTLQMCNCIIMKLLVLCRWRL